MIGWPSPEPTGSWPTKRRRLGRWVRFAIMMAFAAAILIRIAIGPDQEQPKFAPAICIEGRSPDGLYKVDGGYIGETTGH